MAGICLIVRKKTWMYEMIGTRLQLYTIKYKYTKRQRSAGRTPAGYALPPYL